MALFVGKLTATTEKLKHVITWQAHLAKFLRFQWLKKYYSHSFCYLVVIPWLIISTYLVFFKTPEYESTMSILFTQSNPKSVGGSSLLESVLRRSKRSLANEQSSLALLIKKYLYSADLLTRLEKELDLKNYFQSTKIDFFSRLKPNANQESFLNYYTTKFNVAHDPLTGELIFTFKALSSEKAQKVLRYIEQQVISYFTDIAEFSRKEQLHKAGEQLKKTRENLTQLQLALNSLMRKSKVINQSTKEVIEQKQLAVQFAQVEYEAAQRAYMLWSIATTYNPPLTTTHATCPDYPISPKIPHDLINLLVIFSIIYFLGRIIYSIIREHVD